MQRANHHRRVAAAFHSRRIQTVTARMIAHRKCKWQRVLHHHGIATDIRFSANAAKLMNTRVSANICIVFDDYVAGEGGSIGHDHAITEPAIMGNVSLRHE